MSMTIAWIGVLILILSSGIIPFVHEEKITKIDVLITLLFLVGIGLTLYGVIL